MRFAGRARAPRVCIFDVAIIGARGIKIGKFRRRELEYEFMHIYAHECI